MIPTRIMLGLVTAERLGSKWDVADQPLCYVPSRAWGELRNV